MKKRSVLGIILLIILAAGVALVTLDTKILSRSAERFLVKRAAEHGIRLSLVNTSIALTSASAERAEVYIPLGRFFVLLLDVSNVLAQIQKTSILTLEPTIQLTADAYKGHIHSSGIYTILSKTFQGELSLKSINLAEHPQIRSLGFTKGFLTVESPKLLSSKGAFPVGSATISLSEGSKPQETAISLIPFGIPFRITLPRIEDLTLHVALESTGSALKVSSLDCSSSLGSLRGKGVSQIGSRGTFETVSFELDISLSEPGQKAIGPYLPLLSQGALSATVEHFSVTIRGNAARPKVQYF